jgi:glycosyltransferase involved in cell wall biosynthesis
MNSPQVVYLHVWSGAATLACALVQQRYPDAQIIQLSHCELRDGGWRRQIRALRSLQGAAFVVYFEDIENAPQVQLIVWSSLIHRCRETAIVDSRGTCEIYRRYRLLLLFPKASASVVLDIVILLLSVVILFSWKIVARPIEPTKSSKGAVVAYLFPYPLSRQIAGGAISHIRGVLGGFAASGVQCTVFSGWKLPVDAFPIEVISTRRRLFILWETLMLSYSMQFALKVCRTLAKHRPSMLYQRHGRFTVAGALLSVWTRVPLVLEYNGSEMWTAKYWDQSRFRTWLRLCEEVSLRSAAMIVVVSDAIRDELLERGLPPERILVNPNAVDPEHFHPDCGGEKLRQEVGVGRSDVLVGFVGSFSYWHGIPTLESAITEGLQSPSRKSLRFLLVGHGPLHLQMRQKLRTFEITGKVIFSGIVAHEEVRSYLDACDILVSPHVPMSDGRPFFGSPTKLFEYMAMGKAIIASNLDQLAQVLRHNDTALLVTPGDVQDLISAIRLLADDESLRTRLGKRARQVAVERHTWRQNVARVLQNYQGPKTLRRDGQSFGVFTNIPRA